MSSVDNVLRKLGKIAVHTNTQGIVDYPLNEKNVSQLISTLIDFNLQISAVYIVSRPIKGYTKQNTFEHWTVKIQAPPILLSIGFVECNKKGAFKLDQTMCREQELTDFLYYYADQRRYQYFIVSSVVPYKAIDDHKELNVYSIEVQKLHTQTIKTKTKQQGNLKKTDEKHDKHKGNKGMCVQLQGINIKKKVCDIADFVEMWTANGMKYNAITSNCQHFALDLFAYLVASKYPNQVQLAVAQLDPGCDNRKYKTYIDDDEFGNANAQDDEKQVHK